jgi:hypothetical protein
MIAVLAVVVAAVAAVRGVWSPCGLSMLSSLNPVSERARRHRFGTTAAWYLAGAVAGGALLGGGCALVAEALSRGGLPAEWAWALAFTGSAVAVGSDSRLVRYALPDHPRQVDERWLVTYRRWIYAGGFGAQIGTGFATYIMTAAVYLTALLAALSGSATIAFWVGVEFGAVRGLSILLVAAVSTPERLRSLIARVDALGEVSLRIAAATSAGVGAVSAAVLGGPLAAAAAALALGALAVAPAGSVLARPTGSARAAPR